MNEPIASQETKDALDRHIEDMVEEGRHVRRSWWSAQGRVAVPMESGMHYDADQAKNIAAAFMKAGHSTIYSVALEKGGADDYLQLSANSNELDDLNDRLHMVHIALLPADGSAIVLCSPDDYNVVAGPESFVERACGEDIATARESFLKAAFEERLKKIATRYAP